MGNKTPISPYLFNCFHPVLHIKVAIIRRYIKHHNHTL